MDLQVALNHLNRIKQAGQNENWSLHVKVLAPGLVGGTPCVEVTGLNAGFDWDKGKLILDTKTPLTRLSSEDVSAIHNSARQGQSWHAYQAYECRAEAPFCIH